jgi:hypothetical protein|tara:strand:- start:109 stop:471 length:363 start_codon:yes stop_codon:yes gene_type:complete
MAKMPNAEEMAMRTLLGLAATVLSVAAIASAIVVNAYAVERASVTVVNEREFFLSVGLCDKVCGGDVLLRDQLDPGETREIEICVNGEGVGALAVTYGSGCSQVKRTEMKAVEPGSDITF